MPYLIYLLLLLYSTASLAQDRYNDIWFFGKGHSVHFDNATINNGGIPTPPVQGIYSTYATVPFYQNAVTHPNTGTLEFFIQLPNKSQGSVNRTYQVYYDHTGQPLPNGAIDIPYYEGKLGIPVIVPHPSNNRQYYVFTLLNQGLQYTVVDMSLNNGKGAVMPNQKMVSLAPNGTIVGNKITVTQGCNDIKLIVISQAEQAFLSYEIDIMGHINTTPIRSPLSSERIIQYSKPSAYIYPGMKTAPDGKRLAIASINGTYMYSVNACDGSITNEQHIDTVKSFGVGFSPNSRILYFNRAEYNSRYTNSSELVQCDIAPTRSLNEIINSKTVILQNSAYYWPYSNAYLSSYMGDIAMGPDHKLYILSNTKYLDGEPAQPLPPLTLTVPWAQTMHIIEQPNNLGTACNARRDAHLLDGSFLHPTEHFLPTWIMHIKPTRYDTINNSSTIQTCFGNATTLTIDSTATCIQWYNGHDRISLHTSDTGKLWVNYRLGCTPHSDTFMVTTTNMPAIQDYILACAGQGGITLPKLDNHAPYSFELKQQGRTIRSGNSDTTVVLRLLPAGSYALHYRTGGCDTTIAIQIENLPKPWITTIPTDSVAINYGDSVRLTASGAYLYTWSPTLHLDTTQGETVIARPHHPTRYEVVGFNEYGCMDTAYIKVNIDYGMEIFLPNAFTPNGDGLNDVFGLQGQKFQHLKGFYIYNRYGQEVYFSQDVNAGWDGTQNGQPCDVGVYYYMLEVVLPNGKAKAHKGEVHLIR